MKYTIKNKSTGRTREVEADNLEELREDFPAENYEVVENSSGESTAEVEADATAAGKEAESKGKDGEAAAEKVINQSSLSDEDKDDIAERVATKLQKANGESGENAGKEKEGENAGSGEGEKESGESSEAGGKENEGGSEESETSGPAENQEGDSGESDKDKVAPQAEHFWFRARGKKSSTSSE